MGERPIKKTNKKPKKNMEGWNKKSTWEIETQIVEIGIAERTNDRRKCQET